MSNKKSANGSSTASYMEFARLENLLQEALGECCGTAVGVRGDSTLTQATVSRGVLPCSSVLGPDEQIGC